MYSSETEINFIHEEATRPVADPRAQRSYDLDRPVLEGIPTGNTVVLLVCGFDGLSASRAVWRALRKECSNLNVLVCIMERYTRLRRIEPTRKAASMTVPPPSAMQVWKQEISRYHTYKVIRSDWPTLVGAKNCGPCPHEVRATTALAQVANCTSANTSNKFRNCFAYIRNSEHWPRGTLSGFESSGAI